MKRMIPFIFILAFILPAVACKAITGVPQATPTAMIVAEPTQTLQAPTSLPAAPTDTAAPEATEIPTAVQETPTAEPTFLPLVPSATVGSVAVNVIDSVVLATGTTGEDHKPGNPTTVFGTNAVIHAVVHLNNAPAGTRLNAAWYVVDAGSAASPNSQIDSTDVTTDGTRYVDFTLTAKSPWPAGSYKVVISLNGTEFKTLEYTVK